MELASSTCMRPTKSRHDSGGSPWRLQFVMLCNQENSTYLFVPFSVSYTTRYIQMQNSEQNEAKKVRMTYVRVSVSA